MFDYLKMETEEVVSDKTLRSFCNNSVAMGEWLEANGVEFNASLSPVKTSYPSSRYFLYYSGNEVVKEYARAAKPAQRGHRAFGRGLSGASFYTPLKQSAAHKGVQLMAQSRANRLVVDASGEVLGVEVYSQSAQSSGAVKHRRLTRLASKLWVLAPLANYCLKHIEGLEASAERRLIKARRGVILVTGGFVANRAMVEHYAPNYLDGMPLGTSACDGSGIELGESAGAALAQMDRVSAWRFINPPLALAKGIVVNRAGQRYCNEQVYGAKMGYHMVEENNGKALLIFDHSLFWQALKQAMPWKIWFFQAIPALLNLLLNVRRGKSIEELAQRCGLPEEQLVATVADYNRATYGEQPDTFGKGEDFLQGLHPGPFYALDISLDSRLFPCATITVGGLVVDESSGAVKSNAGKPIKGLYAAGRTAVGLASNFYVSCLSIADCVFSGRRAGSHCAARADS